MFLASSNQPSNLDGGEKFFNLMLYLLFVVFVVAVDFSVAGFMVGPRDFVGLRLKWKRTDQ